MNFKNIITLDMQHLQPYIIEDIPGKILINNQKNGLTLFTNSLNFWKDIPLLSDIHIKHIYKRIDDTELLLYCPDNKSLVHVDTAQLKPTIIPLSLEHLREPFIPLYFWDETECLLTTKEHFYHVNIKDKTIERSAQTVEQAEHHHKMLYECWRQYHASWIITFILKDMMVAVQDNNNVTVDFIHSPHQKRQHPPITYNEQEVIEVRHSKDTLVFVKKHELKIVIPESGEETSLTIADPYIFKSIRFLEDSHIKFVALCDYEKKEGEAQLRIYEQSAN